MRKVKGTNGYNCVPEPRRFVHPHLENLQFIGGSSREVISWQIGAKEVRCTRFMLKAHHSRRLYCDLGKVTRNAAKLDRWTNGKLGKAPAVRRSAAVAGGLSIALLSESVTRVLWLLEQQP